jgi:hypothetical protein
MADRLDFEIDVELETADHGACGSSRIDRGVSSDRDGGGDGPGDQAEEPQARAEYLGDGGKPADDVGGGGERAEDLPLLQEGKAPVAAETVPLLGLAKANAETRPRSAMPPAGEDGDP